MNVASHCTSRFGLVGRRGCGSVGYSGYRRLFRRRLGNCDILTQVMVNDSVNGLKGVVFTSIMQAKARRFLAKRSA
jgi:hypothetical protein